LLATAAIAIRFLGAVTAAVSRTLLVTIAATLVGSVSFGAILAGTIAV